MNSHVGNKSSEETDAGSEVLAIQKAHESSYLTTHTIVHIAIDVPDAKTLPVMVELDDPDQPRINYNMAKYLRYQQKEGQASYEKIYKTAKIIGKLRDFYILERGGKTLNQEELKDLIEDFMTAFDKGTVLKWRAASPNDYSFARNAISEYMSWLRDLGGLDAVPEEEVIQINSYREAYKYSRHLSKSLLFHTKKQLKKPKSRGRKRAIVGLRQYKPFPPDLIIKLIELTLNPRDKMLLMLMTFGGRRGSEVIQLFVSDMRIEGGKLNVTLAHPEHSLHRWKTKSGQDISGSRAEYLKTMFNALPRNGMGKDPLAAGWKGVKFDNEGAMSSDFYFIRDVQSYLLYLHDTYMREQRGRHKHHPYYFIKGDGDPLTLKSLKKIFRTACERVEKKYGMSLKGYGPHSLRHYYGFYCADVLKLDLLMIQKYLGHIQPSSTNIYAHISPSTAHKVLADAEKRAKLEGRTRCSEEDRLEIQKEFEERGVEEVPTAWHDTSLIHGIFDTSKLRRALR